jgi:cytochrome c oxidase subunit 1
MKGPKAGDNPWRALSLEWQTSSPPIVENFEGNPVLILNPYAYGEHNTQEMAIEKEPEPTPVG